MAVTALLLSRLQFAFTISFHIIFPSFTIGLAAWLTILEALYLATGRPAYRVVFEFWLKIFGVAFGLGVVSGIVMAFQFGTNWDVLARKTGPIQGVLLSYETFTAFFLEASFFGILVFGRPRVPPWFYLFSTAMVALGTTLSAFWIMVNNSWMQAPVGYAIENGEYVPTDWPKIIFSPVLWVRFPHMLLASYITGAFCVAATGAWYLLRGKFHAEASIMLRNGSYAWSRAHADPTLLRTLERGICGSPSAAEDGCDRGAMARPEARLGGTARLAGRREPAQSLRDHASPTLGQHN
jgi:cytochrome d ubiquinol oxidase subunit I